MTRLALFCVPLCLSGKEKLYRSAAEIFPLAITSAMRAKS
jgi:hypothetical protein